MSDTPRTDAEWKKAKHMTRTGENELVLARFARQLERELKPTPTSASVEKIAREAWATRFPWRATWTRVISADVAFELIKVAITAAIAPLQAEWQERLEIETQELRDKLAIAESYEIAQNKRLATLQAELEQAKESESVVRHANRLLLGQVEELRDSIVRLQSRLATAEVDTNRLDWLEQNSHELIANPLKMPLWESNGKLRPAIDAARAKENRD